MSYFTFAAISELLSSLHAGYGLFPLRDWRGQPGIILRHDVDLDVFPAYQLSRRERDAGVRGSYFFLVTAATYNCQSQDNRRMIREMADDGFEIGLHFDPAIYSEVELERLSQLARAEAAQLEDICGQRVNSVSLHNPSILNEYPLLPGWNNAYDPAIFGPDIYLSDSRMMFRTDPADFFECAEQRTCQLLLHPMHYEQSAPEYPAAKLAFLRRMAGALHATFEPNSTYRERVGDRFIEMVKKDVAEWR